MKIDLKLVDFIDTKLLEVQGNKTMPYNERITVYKLLIELQEFLIARMDEEE